VLALTAAARSRPPSDEPQNAHDLNPEYGRVPQYLVQRKQEDEAAAEAASVLPFVPRRIAYRVTRRLEAEAAAPPGLVLLPEEERLSTLETLRRTAAETTSALAKLPIAIRTAASERSVLFVRAPRPESQGATRRRAELEQQLRDTEESIRLFSAPKVVGLFDFLREGHTICVEQVFIKRDS